MLQAAKAEAEVAVDLYNRASGSRSLEGFVIHMHLAWVYMLHARFQRDGIDFRYHGKGRRLERIDGEVKTWDLARSLKEQFPDENDPVRRNIEFFILLRNKVEHRYERLLTALVAGKVQAHVLNFEETLTGAFGRAESMADTLRFPVFMSSLTPDAVEALKKAYQRLPARLSKFIQTHDARLPGDVQGDWRYDFRVMLLPQTGPKSEADAMMRFVREEEMTTEQREARDVVQTIVRTKEVPVQNAGRHKPSGVASQVQNQIGFKFSTNAHAAAWRHYQVRPGHGAERPANTDSRYCLWDSVHGDYVFTDAWVKKLGDELKDAETFELVVGRAPVPLPVSSPQTG
jgi:hypothetical protein